MLSRVAENVYWMTRNLERAEDTARLINSMTHLLLDLPGEVEVSWDELIKVIGAEAHFNELHPDKQDERSVMRYLIAEASNPSAIVVCINAARENARITRDIIPNEMWEQANELYHYSSEFSKGAIISRRKRDDFMVGLIRRCQTLTGIMLGTLSHDAAYQFMRIGRNLERADMSSRIIDVAAANLLSDEEDFNPAFGTVRWINVLKSLNAFQGYRLQGYLGVNGSDALDYLFHQQQFPRSLGHCLHAIETCLSRIPRRRAPRRQIKLMIEQLEEVNTKRMKRSGLHRFIDEFQKSVNELHGTITDTYFRY
jgi:uncharacterized alpha-E superfamily protein